MLTNERQESILKILKEKKRATVVDLSNALYVSEATVRRDLTEMRKLGLVDRSHGGAIFLETADEVSIFVRMNKNAQEKQAAAYRALEHIPEYRSVFLDSSSTVLALAERMDFSHKTVMTNNLQTAMELSKRSDINLLIPGGAVQFNTNSVTGAWTESLLREFHFDLMLTSCAAVHGEAAYETSMEQREIKRAVFARSEQRVLIFDHTKFNLSGTYQFMPLSAFNKVICDRVPAGMDLKTPLIHG